MQEATFSVVIVRDIVQYVVAQGVEASALYRVAEIDPVWLEDPDRQVVGEVLQKLWREAVAQTGDRDLGLHIGEAFDLAAIGVVGYVLLSCKTYGQVLEKLCQYTQLFSRGITLHHHITDGRVYCDCNIVGGCKNYLLDEPRHPIESTFAALFTATQQLTSHTLDAQVVWFQHPCPADVSEHERIFHTKVQFSQPANRIILSADCLNWSVRSANSKLLSVFEAHATGMLMAQTQSHKYSQTVIAAITQVLQTEGPTIAAVARTLMTSVRQLQRDLQTESTTYQQLLDATRRELALQSLKNPETSVHDIAFFLGFSEPSAFHRAFKRWTGQTPRNYRLSPWDQNQ
ncbi:MAG: AraC family transcriptional regulator [Cyanobacteriota bacterium]|nr:AraC family transcriptional regulator [Cyanobacteriota bacterium]